MSWRESGIADIRAEGIPAREDRDPVPRRRPLFRRRSRGAGRHSGRARRRGRRSTHMWREFHKVHDRTFGFHYEGQQDVELVNLRVQAVGAQHRPALKADTAVARRRRSPSPGATSIGGRPAGSNARSTIAPSSPSGRRSRDRRSWRNTARRSSCRRHGPARPTPTATSSWKRTSEEAGDAAAA